MAARRRLKVYAAEIDGLNDWIVAAPNRKAALQAFGVHQDLFGQGLAREEADPAVAAQALARPETPLRRPKGSAAPFAPAVDSGAAGWAAAAAGLPRPARPAPRKPDRRALDRADAALKELQDRHAAALADIQAERERLDARQAAEEARFAAEIAKAKAAVEAAAQAFKAAGGR